MTQGDQFWTERRDPVSSDPLRFPFERDYARVVHSAAFRRMQAKTQVLGVGDGDFYRTRLTHSLEVSQIGESIARNLTRIAARRGLADDVLPNPMLMRTICLAHDLGHPPFGHGGEVALNRCMRNHGGFEGNGQTLRILSAIEPYHQQHGMNLTRRTLLGVLKYPAAYTDVVDEDVYPKPDPLNRSVFRAKSFKPPKCYLDTEAEVVAWIGQDLEDWEQVCAVEEGEPGGHRKTRYKALDTSIMEIADDIAYGVHDLEDAIGLKLISCDEFSEHVRRVVLDPFCAWHMSHRDEAINVAEIEDRLFNGQTYKRKKMIGAFVDYCVRQTTLDRLEPHKFSHEIFAYRATLSQEARSVLDALQKLVEKKVIFSTTVQQLEFKGQKIITELFHAFAVDPKRLLPQRDADKWDGANDETAKMRVICDHIAGMTDDYATRRYRQLFEPSMGSVFDRL